MYGKNIQLSNVTEAMLKILFIYVKIPIKLAGRGQKHNSGHKVRPNILG